MAERQTGTAHKALKWTAGVIVALVLALAAAWETGTLNGVALWGVGRALGYQISCGRVDGDLLASFHCRDLTLADAKGTFFTAQDFVLDWQALALFGNRLALTRLAISGGRLSRVPESAPSPPKATWLPTIEIAISRLDIRGFALALSEAPAACFNLGGSGWIGPAGFETGLKLVRCASSNGELSFRGRYVYTTGVLSLQAQGTDNGAIAAALTGLTDAGRTMLSLSGSGTLSAFNGTFVLATGNIGRVAATFRAQGFAATRIDARFDLASAFKPRWLPEPNGTLAADLARNADGRVAFKVALAGSGAKLAADGTLRGRNGSAAIVLTAPRPETFGPGIAEALGPAARLDARVRVQDGSYIIDQAALVSAAATASGTATLTGNGTLTARLDITRGEAAPLSTLLNQKVSGAFTLHAAITGSKAAPAIALHADAPMLVIAGQTIKDTALYFTARKAARWSGELSLKAASRAGAVALDTKLQALKNGWQAAIVKGALGPAKLAGTLSQENGTYAGAVTASGDVLKPVGFLLGQEMTGRGAISLSGTGKALRLVVDLAHVAAGPLKQAAISVRASSPAPDSWGGFSLTVKDGINTLAVAASARLNPLEARLTTLNGAWNGVKVALSHPAEFQMANGIYTLKPSELAIGGGTLALSAQGSKGTLKASAHLKNLPAATVATVLAGEQAEGLLNVDLSVDMSAQAARADLTFAGRHLAFVHRRKAILPADLDVAAHWNGQALTLNGTLTALAAEPATLSAQLPLQRVPGSLVPMLAQQGPISAQLHVAMRAERLFALLPVAEQSLSGAINASLSAHGDIAHPVLAGDITLKDAQFQNFETGTTLQKLDASLTAAGGSTVALKLSATDSGSGKVSATGGFSLAALENGDVGRFTGQADVTLDKAELLRTDQVRAGASGKVTLALPGEAPPKISGMLHTSTVRVDIEAAMPPQVPEIEVTEINGPPRAVPPPPAPSLFSQAPLDLSITMPNRVYVNGHGLDSEWRGKLNIGGTVAKPAIAGNLDLVRGQMELVGKVFTLQSGTVIADANAKGGATINLAAQNSTTDLTVNVTAKGPVAEPEIAWSSTPPLPKDEILSRLFFGTSTPHLSGLQALQLAELSGQFGALGSLMGGGGILTFARRLTGLDVLRVETSSGTTGASTGASITAGKYLSDKVYVGVKQGAGVTAGSALVEVRITPHITLDAVAGANAQGSVGATWKWDY